MAWGFALGLHIGSFDRERLIDVFFLNAYNRRFECAVACPSGWVQCAICELGVFVLFETKLGERNADSS